MEYKKVLRWMMDWFPQGISIRKINKDLAREYRDAIQKVPVNFDKTPGFKALNFREAVEKAAVIGGRR